MMHYHGTPITPRVKLHELAGRSFCVPWSDPRDLAVCHEIGQSVMLDNGAFTFWRHPHKRKGEWSAFYAWVEPWLDYWTTWAVIPDVIDGDERANDALVDEWPFGRRGAPVWHLHESVDRLVRLASEWPLVCLGSSGAFAKVGDAAWHARMVTAMNQLCGDGPPPCALHMLRGLNVARKSSYPFASADSSSIAQNHAGNNTRNTPRKDVNTMADHIDSHQCPARWYVRAEQQAGLL